MQSNAFYIIKLSLVALVVAMAFPDFAWAAVGAAATNLRGSVDTLTGGMKYVPTVVSGACYIGAGCTMYSGCVYLMKHAENSMQNPKAAGLSRITLGAAVAALPSAISWGLHTLNMVGSSQNATYIGFKPPGM